MRKLRKQNWKNDYELRTIGKQHRWLEREHANLPLYFLPRRTRQVLRGTCGREGLYSTNKLHLEVLSLETERTAEAPRNVGRPLEHALP